MQSDPKVRHPVVSEQDKTNSITTDVLQPYLNVFDIVTKYFSIIHFNTVL
jgi:hypothetical protein